MFPPSTSPPPSSNQCPAATSHSTSAVAAVPGDVLIPNQVTFIPLPIAHSFAVAGTAQPAGAASCPPLSQERSMLSKVTVPKKRSAKATTPLTEVAASESGRGHHLRKAPATKEIVPLTDLS
jgi:hypothetical protein